ncbi:discoidin domain-containing protein [Micromonospora sp. NPDC049102]|uniref:discoidin domain-containing protein n=1 Tax=Micromonospora sp. NPDC049102 TaxID=3364265 RepID=UPI00371D29FF
MLRLHAGQGVRLRPGEPLGDESHQRLGRPGWIYVDLGATATVTQVVLQWDPAYARSYQIQVSPNASTWTTVYSTTTGKGFKETIDVTGAGRYVRRSPHVPGSISDTGSRAAAYRCARRGACRHTRRDAVTVVPSRRPGTGPARLSAPPAGLLLALGSAASCATGPATEGAAPAPVVSIPATPTLGGTFSSFPRHRRAAPDATLPGLVVQLRLGAALRPRVATCTAAVSRGDIIHRGTSANSSERVSPSC